MPTGDFWNTSDPLRPWALFDVDAIIDIPFDVSAWLTSLGSTYASHSVTAASPLECVTSAHSAGIIKLRLKVASGAEPETGKKYPFSVRLVCADGQQDDRTLYLKLVQR